MDEKKLLTAIRIHQEKAQALELSSTAFRSRLDETLTILGSFIDGIGNAPGYPTHAPASIAKSLDAKLGSHRSPVADLIMNQIEGGVETASGHFMGYIPGGGLLTAAIADLITATTNRYAGFHFTAPGAARTENEVIKWLCELFELGSDAWGSLTSGGTMATLNCFLAARESVKDEPLERLVVYMSDQAHHASARTLRAMGFKNTNLRMVPTDALARLSPEALRSAVKEDQKHGRLPFLLIASAGTTNTGAIDPLEELATIAKEHGLWFHVDAAYGGLFVLSDLGKPRLRGINHADSIVVDPHKGMFLPYGIGASLVRNHAYLKNAFNDEAPYLAREDAEARSPADYSFELTRHNRAPRIKLSLDLFGEKVFSAALSEKLLLAEYLSGIARIS